MKSILLWLLLAVGPCFGFAQTTINQSFPVTKGQTVSFHFEYPKNIQVSTWGGNEVVVEADVNIDNGESDHVFALTEKVENGKVSIVNKLDMDAIPTRYYVSVNGNKVRFESKKDMETYIAENTNKSSISTYQTKDIEIKIRIKVPVNVATELTSVYGMVEIKNFNAPIKVNATYGGVDVSVAENAIGKLQLTTQYGKIYSNLNLKSTEHVDKNFLTSITALQGKGPDYNFDSAFGNIYLRNAVQ